MEHTPPHDNPLFDVWWRATRSVFLLLTVLTCSQGPARATCNALNDLLNPRHGADHVHKGPMR